jgi:trk system potassium uptake protein TrkH
MTSSVDIRPVGRLLGALIAMLGAMMLVPALADFLAGEPEWMMFVEAALFSGFAGAALMLATREAAPPALSIRQGFLLTGTAWMVLAAFGAIPIRLAVPELSYAGAYFETMSGLTTTGSTVITGLDDRRPGLLLWRSLLQSYGGIGIIVVGIVILPALQVGGMQLFRSESSDKSEKLFPRLQQVALTLLSVYVALNAACAFAYALAGMSVFDAVNHALTTISTGGFSTHDASILHFRSAAIDWIAIVFMLCGAVPLWLLVLILRGEGASVLRNPEIRVFLGIVAVLSLALFAWLVLAGIERGHDALRGAVFTIVTIITTTGFTGADFTNWGALSDLVIVVAMLAGGCTGSTAGGIKAFRLIVAAKAVTRTVRELINPSGVFPLTYGGRRLKDDVPASIFAFLLVYAFTLMAISILLAALGLSLQDAATAALTAMTNVGPGLGAKIGPMGNFADMSDPVYWLLSFAMVFGRLEIFTVLVLFTPRFWRG